MKTLVFLKNEFVVGIVRVQQLITKCCQAVISYFLSTSAPQHSCKEVMYDCQHITAGQIKLF